MDIYYGCRRNGNSHPKIFDPISVGIPMANPAINAIGNLVGNPVGMGWGWEWELKFYSYANPDIYGTNMDLFGKQNHALLLLRY